MQVMDETQPELRGIRPSGPLLEEAEMALRQAVGKAIAEHKRLGVPMAFFRDGKVVEISAEEAEVEYLAKKAEYEAAQKAGKSVP